MKDPPLLPEEGFNIKDYQKESQGRKGRRDVRSPGLVSSWYLGLPLPKDHRPAGGAITSSCAVDPLRSGVATTPGQRSKVLIAVHTGNGMAHGALWCAPNSGKTSWTLSMLSMGWLSTWTCRGQTWMAPGPCSQSKCVQLEGKSLYVPTASAIHPIQHPELAPSSQLPAPSISPPFLALRAPKSLLS